MIYIENLYKHFKNFWGKKIEILKGISFEVKRGEILGLIGPNGAGKTTTFKICTGLLKPTRGRVYFEKGMDIKNAREKIGFLPELPYFYEYLTGKEYLRFILRIYGKKNKNENRLIEEICERFNIKDITGKPIKTLSRGQKQKIGMASVFINNPGILILDEPLSGLDPVSRKEIKEILKEEKKEGKTILFSSHILSDAEEICDSVVIINKGKIIARGGMDEIIPLESKRARILFEYKEGVKELDVNQNELNNCIEEIFTKWKGKIIRITLESPKLEDVFYKLIKDETSINI